MNIDEWGEEKKTVTLTNKQWSFISTYILLTKNYREKRIKEWEELTKKVDKDGRPQFESAKDDYEYFKGMYEELEKIKEEIEKV